MCVLLLICNTVVLRASGLSPSGAVRCASIEVITVDKFNKRTRSSVFSTALSTNSGKRISDLVCQSVSGF